MDTGLNSFRGTQGRRNQRQEKKGRKYNAKAAAAIRTEYKSKLKQSNFSEEERLALRKRIIDEQKKKRTKNLIILLISALCISAGFVWVLGYL